MEKHNKKKKKNLQDKVFISGKNFIGLEKLGKGTFGSVYKVHNLDSNLLYAIKKIKLDVDREGIPSTVLREISILKSSNHPNVVKIENIAIGNKTIEICLEYFPLDLRKFIEKYKNNDIIYNINTVRSIIYQIIRATNYLHSRKILHRDLKPQNILFCDQTLLTKIADFGLSRVYSIPIRSYTQKVLTMYYRAPELLMGLDQYSIGVDIWSIGCVMAELLIKFPLFIGESEIDQLKKIFEVLGSPDENIFPGCKFPEFKFDATPIGVENFVKKRLKIDMDTVSLDDALDLLRRLLALNPYERISAKEALGHVRL
jgi:serine/threonine protein kinase